MYACFATDPGVFHDCFLSFIAPEDAARYELVAVTATSGRYVLNTNTHKFHYPDCRSVDQIKPENFQWADATREEIIASGYSPCGNCKP